MTKAKTRTTSKAFKEQIVNHIKDIKEDDMTFEQVFEQWLNESPPRKNENYQDSFVKWCSGLPTGFGVLYENEKIIQELEKWFKNADIAFDRKRVEDDPMTYYLNLIHREMRPAGSDVIAAHASKMN